MSSEHLSHLVCFFFISLISFLYIYYLIVLSLFSASYFLPLQVNDDGTAMDNLWVFFYNLLHFLTKYFVVVFSFLPRYDDDATMGPGMTMTADGIWYVIFCYILFITN